jgi:hypothetical protein
MMVILHSFCVMPGLVPGIHVFCVAANRDVDGRDKPGHDVRNGRVNFT